MQGNNETTRILSLFQVIYGQKMMQGTNSGHLSQSAVGHSQYPNIKQYLYITNWKLFAWL